MHVKRSYRFASGQEVTPSSWRDRALCRPDRDGSVWTGADPLFFPEGRHDSQRVIAAVKAAKAVCAGCPVLPECRAYALANPWLTAYGVWGGLSEAERTDPAAASFPAAQIRPGAAA